MSGSNTSGSSPPPYDAIFGSRNAAELRGSFATLVNDQVQIQQLFKSVAGQLETTPQIGENHPLAEEWNRLRQRHRKVYRDSQHNAGQCASFLNNYVEVVIPLAQSSMPMDDKKVMINKFLEAMTIHQESARRTADRFHELGKQVEMFQLKVASTLRCQAEPSGFFQSVWSGLEELCMTIWQALYKLLKAIVDTFRSMLSRIRTIRFFCGIRIDIEFEMYSQLPAETPQITGRGTASQIKEDCKDISNRLTGFEEAWHTVRLSCSELLVNVAMANSMTSIPAAFDANIKSARGVYMPLVECLQAYAVGRSPEL